MNILNIKSVNELIFKKRKKILNPPKSAPNISLNGFTFLFKIIETVVSKARSKKKFKIKIKSRYSFICLTKNSIKKRQVLFCLFI